MNKNNSIIFSNSKVKFYLDTNPHKQGSLFRKFKAMNSVKIKKHKDPILTSSFWHQDIDNILISYIEKKQEFIVVH